MVSFSKICTRRSLTKAIQWRNLLPLPWMILYQPIQMMRYGYAWMILLLPLFKDAPSQTQEVVGVLKNIHVLAEVFPEGKHGKESDPQGCLENFSGLVHKLWIGVCLEISFHAKRGPHDDVKGKQTEEVGGICACTWKKENFGWSKLCINQPEMDLKLPETS